MKYEKLMRVNIRFFLNSIFFHNGLHYMCVFYVASKCEKYYSGL